MGQLALILRLKISKYCAQYPFRIKRLSKVLKVDLQRLIRRRCINSNEKIALIVAKLVIRCVHREIGLQPHASRGEVRLTTYAVYRK